MLYRIIGLLIIVVFYSVYFLKMVFQRKKGIKTNQMTIGKKSKRVIAIERILSLSTVLIVLIELITIILNWTLSINSIKIIGVIISILGIIVFTAAVYTMKDSWRAGINTSEKTELVSNGIYKLSRNPAFLGFDLVYIGLLMIFFNWLLFGVTVFVIIMFHIQIVEEEKHLSLEYGNEYNDYRKRVRRYFGRKTMLN